eukprot:CAMPEP_0113312232 /NCGR_PEP_ID=MMETSP0010_2-20120614/9141_1 /TAXON_ID=216773 ORGANISM="Corethron hystrix, Strain 308" /NCGR_SAMPLE_ID=MMETSP0010_2 /ASSEMBLY_ACC=CAM_ASM_000155 /LENGTH=270 /DNA_ID=CAMNT_0000168009 /DNA_START=68 /DNA_END=880 /DNA_ORIENTATION=- /assembly_acc=CAM_ASM_000155
MTMNPRAFAATICSTILIFQSNAQNDSSVAFQYVTNRQMPLRSVDILPSTRTLARHHQARHSSIHLLHNMEMENDPGVFCIGDENIRVVANVATAQPLTFIRYDPVHGDHTFGHAVRNAVSAQGWIGVATEQKLSDAYVCYSMAFPPVGTITVGADDVAILFPIEKSFPQRLEDGSICAEQQRGADRGRLNFLSKLTEEMIEHQNALNLAHAIDIRNKSQLESFVDEAHQWEEMDDVDRSLLENLRSGVYEGRIDALKEAQRLVQSWRSF